MKFILHLQWCDGVFRDNIIIYGNPIYYFKVQIIFEFL